MGRFRLSNRMVEKVEVEEITAEEQIQQNDQKVEENVPKDVADDDDDDEDEEEEEELVDPVDALRVACSQDAESKALLTALAECTARVESRDMTEETCQQEQFDFIGHRDHCVAHHLFSHLK